MLEHLINRIVEGVVSFKGGNRNSQNSFSLL